MKQTINSYDFIDAFHRFQRYDQFGYEALEILFNYLEELEQEANYLERYEGGTGKELELDVIALCCDYSADTVTDVAAQYDIDLQDCETDEDRLEAVTDYLTDRTSVCGVTKSGTIVYCSAF